MFTVFHVFSRLVSVVSTQIVLRLERIRPVENPFLSALRLILQNVGFELIC